MNDGKPIEDEKGKSPPRVPLLEDVFRPGEPANKPAGKNGSRNHSLAPGREPEPEQTATSNESAETEPPPELEPATVSNITPDKSAEAGPSSELEPTTASDIAPDKPTESEPSSEPAGDNTATRDAVREEIGKGVKLDPFIREWLLGNVKSMSGMDSKGIDRQAILRTGAELMVDNLVKEFSQEIVKRLRRELTSLLDELDIDEEKPGDD